jgi:hypothetical protein
MVEDANRWAMSEAEQKKMVEALIMRRRSFRTAPIGSISTSRQDLLEKTWTAIVEKSNRSSLNLLQD